MGDDANDRHDGFRPLDPRVVAVWRVSGLVSVAAVALAGSVGLIAAALAGNLAAPLRWLAPTALGAAAAVGAVIAVAWPAARYRRTRYRVDERGLRLRRGVLWRSDVAVPRSRVQHTDVTRGPVERALGLATLVIYTAGTEHASISLGGLAAGDAVAARDLLVAGDRDGDDAV